MFDWDMMWAPQVQFHPQKPLAIPVGPGVGGLQVTGTMEDVLGEKCSHCDARFHSSVARMTHEFAEHANATSERQKTVQDGQTNGKKMAETLSPPPPPTEQGLVPSSMEQLPSPSHKEYKCKLCPQVFISKSDAQRHARHSHTEEKPYKCPSCGKSFANSSYLAQHSRIHTGIKPYQCTYCERTFKQLSHLQQHVRLHTGDRPYKCTHPGCGKAFTQLSNLQSHSKRHNSDKPYQCNKCFRAYGDAAGLQESYLVKHMLKHSSQCPHTGPADDGIPHTPPPSTPQDSTKQPSSPLLSPPPLLSSPPPSLLTSDPGLAGAQNSITMSKSAEDGAPVVAQYFSLDAQFNHTAALVGSLRQHMENNARQLQRQRLPDGGNPKEVSASNSLSSAFTAVNSTSSLSKPML
ncbi:ZNF362 [Branchiostoma lanceolatum]|uniref:ZNF362 protein n=1 Tax=Branchiostoma lanceolatum TaxID=7740 RepID=A0A8J9YMS4_BRALA|nr:ZNF362 [Branchiostoma lanceolatum]